MEDQYGMTDLRQYMAGRTFFPPISRPPPPPDVLSSHRGLASPQYPYDMLMFRPESTIIGPTSVITTANTSGGASSSAAGGGSGLSGFEMDCSGMIGFSGGGDGGTGRWPRQETLALLEIRSRLDPKFKEANQKGPLWDEVSRIMSEEHGYQRTGKKCREKFENLYKYYKKTKEGKAGRQDGKHYRFFRQLEALYGENNTNLAETHFVGSDFHYKFPHNNVNLSNNQESYLGAKLSDTSLMSVSNSSDHDNSDTTSSDDTNDPKNKKRRGKRSLKSKIKDFIDSQMRKLMEKQEAWMEKMMNTIEHKEQERILREEQWRKQDADRIEREQKLWASERAWIEARDAALMEAFHKLTRNELSDSVMKCDQVWPECEITRLIQLRTQMELKFQENGISEEVLWEEISAKMACFGHERSGLMCKEKWDSVNNYLLKCNKKRKEINSKICSSTIYQNNGNNIYGHHQGGLANYCDTNELEINDQNAGNYPINDGFFRYFMN